MMVTKLQEKAENPFEFRSYPETLGLSNVFDGGRVIITDKRNATMRLSDIKSAVILYLCVYMFSYI